MLREPLRINRRRGNDDFQVGTLYHQLLHVTQQKIDIQAALVGLVNDQRVVGPQAMIAVRFREENAVGHDLDKGILVGMVVEADFVANRVRTRRAKLLRQARGKASRRDSPRLGAADHAILTTTQFKTDFRKLRGLARAGFATHDHHLVFLDEGGNFGAARGDRQCIVEYRMGQERMPLLARCIAFARLCQRSVELRVELIKRFFLAREVVTLFCQRNQASAISRQYLLKIDFFGRHVARILRVQLSRIRDTYICAAKQAKKRAFNLIQDNTALRHHARLYALHKFPALIDDHCAS